jgi:nitroreductase
MYWPTKSVAQNKLAAELLFQYHKIEKGLVMSGPVRLFGIEPALATVKLARRWVAVGFARQDSVFLGALETLRSYHARITNASLDPEDQVTSVLGRLFTDFPERAPVLATPVAFDTLAAVGSSSDKKGFAKLALARRSVRNFKSDLVPIEIIETAIRSAQLAPSACNRQPCRIYLLSDPSRRKELLSFQNGNRGFGHLAPHIAILTADESCFFDASERHEPYIDGGLFAMSFILALRDMHVSSCCLNWCVPPQHDSAIHQRFSVPRSQRIVMLIAIGYAELNTFVPRSPRRLLSDVLHVIQ